MDLGRLRLLVGAAMSDPCWTDGWWAHATKRPAHHGRVGGPIWPFSVVVHTCDMVPEDFAALITAWTSQPGVGACAHFVIGASQLEGVVQLVSIAHNGNHAGGPEHGVFMDQSGRKYHPNTVAVGIELHRAGGVHLVSGQWRLVEDGKPHGLPIPSSEVIPDPARPSRGWHRVTDYQYERLESLLGDLERVLEPMPAGLVACSTVERVPDWGVPRNARVVGHVTLDPQHRSDPWPPTMKWLVGR